MARESSIRTKLVPFPELDGVDETPYPYAGYLRIVCGVAESNGAECVDVVPVLRRSDTRLTVGSVETHPSPFVYERVAEKLEAILSP